MAVDVRPLSLTEVPRRIPVSEVADAESFLRTFFWSPFDFKTGKHRNGILRVARLDDFVDAVKTVDIKALEYGIYAGDIERWISETVGDKQLAREFANIRYLARFGESLRDQVFLVSLSRLEELQVNKAQ